MSTHQLTEFERRAVEVATKAIVSSLLESTLGAIWECGVTDLSAIDEGKLQEINAVAFPHLTPVIGAALESYAKEMRRSILANDAPF